MSRRNAMRALGIVALAAWLAGCAPSAGGGAKVAASLDMPAEAPTDLPEPVFMGELAAQGRVNQNDAFRAVLLWLDGKDEADFKARCVALADRGLIHGRWRLNPAAPMDKATLAYVIYKALGMRGGINMALFNNRRYALRELVYRGMMAGGADYAFVSGSELIAVLGRADDYRAVEEGVEHEQLPDLLRD
jgi:hypothetical protein